jgi:microcystin degradation protein MlrC
MAFRLAIAGLAHETNTFCHPTPLAAFRRLRRPVWPLDPDTAWTAL